MKMIESDGQEEIPVLQTFFSLNRSPYKDIHSKTMAFRWHRPLASSLLLSYLIHLTSSAASSGNSTWCMTEDSYDAYGVALKYLGVQTMREPQLDQLIQDVFGRFGCQQMAFENNITCENVRHNTGIVL